MGEHQLPTPDNRNTKLPDTSSTLTIFNIIKWTAQSLYAHCIFAGLLAIPSTALLSLLLNLAPHVLPSTWTISRGFVQSLKNRTENQTFDKFLPFMWYLLACFGIGHDVLWLAVMFSRKGIRQKWRAKSREGSVFGLVVETVGSYVDKLLVRWKLLLGLYVGGWEAFWDWYIRTLNKSAGHEIIPPDFLHEGKGEEGEGGWEFVVLIALACSSMVL